jgi:probable F420-dependent oxidoreductase
MELDLYCTNPSPTTVAELARTVEATGFSGLWFTESSHNPYVASALAAAETSSITIGTDIAVAFPRSPMVTAQVSWDLAALSRGRFILGLGTQVKAHMEKRFSVPFSRPAARLREYVLALRAIFDAFQGTAPLRFAGEFYSFSLLTEFFSPGPIDQPEVPIYVAAVNVGLAAVAGEVCDGVHAHPFHSVRYLTDVVRPAIAAGAARAGRDPASVALAVPSSSWSRTPTRNCSVDATMSAGSSRSTAPRARISRCSRCTVGPTPRRGSTRRWLDATSTP